MISIDANGYLRRDGALVICECRDRALRVGDVCPTPDCQWPDSAPAPSTSTASGPGAPNATAEQCIRFADMIDNRLEAVGGRTADTLAAFLRRVAAELTRFAEDRRDHDLALHDAIRETAGCADELAFWRYQAVWHRAYFLRPVPIDQVESGPEWKEAEQYLEVARVAENRERTAHAEAPRDPGGT